MLFRKKKEEEQAERDTEIEAYRATIEALKGIADGNEALARALATENGSLNEKYKRLGDDLDQARQAARGEATRAMPLVAENKRLQDYIRIYTERHAEEERLAKQKIGELEQAGIGLANELRRLQGLLIKNGIDSAKVQPSRPQPKAPPSYGGWTAQDAGPPPRWQVPPISPWEAGEISSRLRDEMLRQKQAEAQEALNRSRFQQAFNQASNFSEPPLKKATVPPPPKPSPWANLSKEERLAFDTLGCLPGDDVKKAWREAAAKNHPDRGGDNAKMVAVNAAYDLLKVRVK